MVCLALIWLACTAHAAESQPAKELPEPGPDPTAQRSLLEQDPFDLITLDESSKSAQLKVLPLLEGKRKAPFPVDLRGTYRVRLVEHDDREYEVQGRRIVRVELYEELLLKEAQRLVAESRFDEAFDYFYRLHSSYADLPGLEQAVNDYLYLDAVQLARNQRYPEALGIVEDLLGRRRDYRYRQDSPTLIQFLDGLLDRILKARVERKDFREARILLSRINRDYRAEKLPAVSRWTEQLTQLAIGKREEARRHLEAGRFHEAIVAVKEMLAIWPDVEGGRALNDELFRRYPVVTVGVLQVARDHDARRLDDWAARRTGRLVRRSLVDFLSAGPEGGQYEFALGSIERSDDRRRLTLRLNPAATASLPVTGYLVGRRLLDLASPLTRDYSPSWASLIESVEVRDVYQVDVSLRRAHVLPEALLRLPLEPPGQAAEQVPAGGGPFSLAERAGRDARFVCKSFQPGKHLAEIVERTYTDAQQALGALRRGEIDVLDRLFPADGVRLQKEFATDGLVHVEQYALPMVHLLVPNTSKNPFLANRDFRRALIVAIDREKILREELLGGREVLGCRVVSGPFPSGAGESDPLGYAYDASIKPREYEPRVAKLLSLVAQKQVAETAGEDGGRGRELPDLVIGHPSHEVARVACQAIVAAWKTIGVNASSQAFPPGVCRDTEEKCDLVYTEIAIWEPVVDAPRLLSPGGPAGTPSPYVRQALYWLDQAQSWSEVRERLLQVHRAVHGEDAILPLWQLVDFLAYHKRWQNIGERPVWLYQHVDQWQRESAAAE